MRITSGLPATRELQEQWEGGHAETTNGGSEPLVNHLSVRFAPLHSR